MCSSLAHLQDVYLCDRDLSNPIRGIHTQVELISIPKNLKANFKSMDNRKCWDCIVFNVQQGKHLKYNTKTTGIVQNTSDHMMPVGHSPEKGSFSPNGYLAQADTKWKSDKINYSSGGKPVL